MVSLSLEHLFWDAVPFCLLNYIKWLTKCLIIDIDTDLSCENAGVKLYNRESYT